MHVTQKRGTRQPLPKPEVPALPHTADQTVFLESAVDFLSDLEAEAPALSLVPRLWACDPGLPQPKWGGVVVGRSGPARQRKAWNLLETSPGRPFDGEGGAQLWGRGTGFLSKAFRS